MEQLKEYLPIFLSAVLGLLGWWNKTLRNDIDRNKEDFHKFQLKVAEEYVHKQTLELILGDIKDHLIRIENKLDMKQDKN